MINRFQRLLPTFAFHRSVRPYSEVLTFGRGAYGRLGLATVELDDDEPHATPSVVEGLPARAVAVMAGANNTAAVVQGGAAYVWGYGDLGQLGRGEDQSDAMTPIPLVPTKLMKARPHTASSFRSSTSLAEVLFPFLNF